MRAFDIPFEETVITLRRDDTKAEILKFSPSGLVPALKSDDMVVTDSLAIVEYLADRFPEKEMWPTSRQARGYGRMMSAEMHSGFQALRQDMPMDFLEVCDRSPIKAEVQANIDRIIGLWQGARSQFGSGGPYLLGKLSLADAMYAPVVSRFRTYQVPLPEACQAYADAIWDHPAMQAWYQGVLLEG